MALSIPVEIWLLIASYVGKSDYYKLINVNRVFFNIIMDNRYREVYIKYADNVGVRRKLIRLCDPLVASRVRRLHFYPGSNPHSGSRWNKAKRDYWEFSKRLNFFRKDSVAVPYAHTVKAPDRSCVTQPLVQSLLTAVKCMSNVTELIVSCPGPIPTELKPFLPTVANSFGPRLRSLTLRRTFPSVKSLALSLSAHATHLVALEELCLEFGHGKHHSMWGIAPKKDAIDMGRSVAQFINKLAPQLRQLSISSWSDENLDLSPLFSALAPSFPALHHISLFTPFPQSFSSNPSVLARFLCQNSKTIRSANLTFLPDFVPQGYDNLVPYYERDDEDLASWLEELSADPVVLSGLHSLNFYPTFSSQSGFNALVSLTRRSAETLRSLIVPARYLTHEEVTALVSTFSANRSTSSGNLVTLSLNIRRLDPPLIRLLATNLPGLKELSLRMMWPRNNSVAHEITAANMRGHYYPDWGLRDLGIFDGNGNVDEVVLHLIAKAVPSIKSFGGDVPLDHWSRS